MPRGRPSRLVLESASISKNTGALSLGFSQNGTETRVVQTSTGFAWTPESSYLDLTHVNQARRVLKALAESESIVVGVGEIARPTPGFAILLNKAASLANDPVALEAFGTLFPDLVS